MAALLGSVVAYVTFGACVGQTAASTRAAVPLLLLMLFAVQGAATTVFAVFFLSF